MCIFNQDGDEIENFRYLYFASEGFQGNSWRPCKRKLFQAFYAPWRKGGGGIEDGRGKTWFSAVFISNCCRYVCEATVDSDPAFWVIPSSPSNRLLFSLFAAGITYFVPQVRRDRSLWSIHAEVARCWCSTSQSPTTFRALTRRF